MRSSSVLRNQWTMPDPIDILTALADAIDLLSIAEVTNTYRDRLTNFAYDAMNGRMDAVDMSRAMRALLRDLADDAYTEGMREGGIDKPEEVLDSGDENAIKAWIDGQLSHVSDFAKACAAVKAGENSRDDILTRIDYWVDNLTALGSLGVASAKQNVMGTWVFGDTDHCPTCEMLNGKRRRLKWFVQNGYIPQERGSGVLDCKGFNCQCHIEDDNGEWLMPIG